MKYLVVGGAGFIGSYCVDRLLQNPETKLVRVYDNFTSGKLWHLESHRSDQRLEIIAKDIYDPDIFPAAIGVDVAYLFAANPEIAKAISEPDIDFKQGTVLTQITLEALRKGGCPRLLYASGSGVYGDVNKLEASENFSPMQPISTYGASKLGCEVLISSYCHMFGLRASALRFGNVVGGRQTHGVAYDFIKRLMNKPDYLEILGDGTQSKPYVFIDDVMDAMALILNSQIKPFDVFNVAPLDYTNVTEIANMVLDQMLIPRSKCELRYGGGDRGWKGDVPIVRLNTNKIRSLGWSNKLSSAGAIQRSIEEMLCNSESLYGKS
jgi:UDP-glucose 4-epimerase